MAAEMAQATLRIKWVRSEIGCPRRQRANIRSLGLHRLNQVTEVPDTPQVRGLLARVPHLVEIVGAQPEPFWVRVAEYSVLPAGSVSSTEAARSEGPEEPVAAAVSTAKPQAEVATVATEQAPDRAASGKPARTKAVKSAKAKGTKPKTSQAAKTIQES
jgi:large subunit ribosomal protein L30